MYAGQIRNGLQDFPWTQRRWIFIGRLDLLIPLAEHGILWGPKGGRICRVKIGQKSGGGGCKTGGEAGSWVFFFPWVNKSKLINKLLYQEPFAIQLHQMVKCQATNSERIPMSDDAKCDRKQ